MADEQRDTPENLYKYQAINLRRVDWTSRIFSHNEIYFASPAEFNDPFDCRADAVRIRGSKDAWRRYLRELLRKQHPGWSRKEVRWEAASLVKKGVHRDPKRIQAVYAEWQKDIDQLGIYCLSETRDDILMWSHYSAGHAGYCLEFSVRPGAPIFADALPVTYRDSRPNIDYFRATNIAKFEAALLTKATAWEYEKEWRLIETQGGPGVRKFDPSLLTGVVLGARMRGAQRQRLLAFASTSASQPAVYEAVVSRDRYKLDVRRIV